MTRKIVHIITNLGQGGAENQLRYVANGLVEKGYSTTIISLRNNIKPTGFDCDVVRLNFNKGYRFVPELFKLIKLLRILKPDVIQTWLYHADLVGMIAGKLAGCKRIFWNIRCSDLNLAKYFPGTKFVVAMLAKLSPFVDGIVANSQAGIDFHHSIGYTNKHWYLIANGFDMAKFKPIIHQDRDYLTFGMVARVDPMKDYQTFISAAKVIHKSHPTTKFLCIGTGTQKLSDDVIAGLGSREDLSELYNTIDVFVLMSLSEGFPNVVGEAMASGLPCIATDVGDTKKLVAENGIIINVQSEDELICAMNKYITMTKDQRQAIGAGARAHIATHYSLEKAIENYDKLYSRK